MQTTFYIETQFEIFLQEQSRNDFKNSVVSKKSLIW